MDPRAVTVVTGAGSGIGAAVARLLASGGDPVVAIDINGRGLAELEQGDRIATLEGDVADPATWDKSIVLSQERFGEPPTQLVASAAVVEVGTTLTLPEEAWRRTLEVNLMGTVRGARALLSWMVARRRGSIVTIASVDAFMAEQGLAAYCASKGALLQFTRVLALDHAREGIRANCVCPGVTDTPLFRYHVGLAPDPEALVAERLARQPAGRFLSPEDVAHVACFLLSDAAAGITGAMVPVDGGLSTGFDFRATAT